MKMKPIQLKKLKKSFAFRLVDWDYSPIWHRGRYLRKSNLIEIYHYNYFHEKFDYQYLEPNTIVFRLTFPRYETQSRNGH